MLVRMHQAKTRLSELVERALSGEDIVIARGDTPVVRLTPVRRPDHPQPGRMADVLAPMTLDDFRPLDNAALQELGFDALLDTDPAPNGADDLGPESGQPRDIP